MRKRWLEAAMVAIQENTWMPDGTATAMLAVEKKARLSDGMPVVNMWCTHSPNEKKPAPISATTMRSWPTSGRRAIVDTTIETRPAAGRKMM